MSADEDAGLEQRLWNWGDWARSDGRRQGRCASAERYYRGDKYPEESLRTVDDLDAARIEAAVCQVREYHREILKGMYVYRASWLMIERRLGVRVHDSDAWVLRVRSAKAAIHQVLCR